MRCPKCGYISFDVVQSCTKCGKNISEASKDLHGTVASSAPPVFLRFQGAEPEEEIGHGTEPEAEMTYDLGGGEEAVLDLDAGEPALEPVEMDFGVEEAAEEPILDLGGPSLEEQAFEIPSEEPAAESFDIGDLAPQVEEAPIMEEAVEEVELAAAEESEAAQKAGLADLKVEGIDLEAAPGKGKVMPSVKTGTALDDFDIDLGDLLPKKK